MKLSHFLCSSIRLDQHKNLVEDLGNFLLKPCFYLFGGRDITVFFSSDKNRFESEISLFDNKRHWFRTTLSIIALVPGILLGSSFKGLAYLWSKNVRIKYSIYSQISSRIPDNETQEKPAENVSKISSILLKKKKPASVHSVSKKSTTSVPKLNRNQKAWLKDFLGVSSINQNTLIKYSISLSDVIQAYDFMNSDQDTISLKTGSRRSILSRETLTRLKSSGWLNDELINDYLSVILEDKKTLLAGSYFFKKMNGDFFPANFFRDFQNNICEDVLSKNHLVIPLHEEARRHWTLVVVDLKKKRIEYYDSLGDEIPEACRTLKSHLISKDTSQGTWEIRKGAQIKQSNGYDCGIFVLQTAKKWLNPDKYADFTQKETPYLRLSVLTSLINNANQSSLSQNGL